MHWRILISHDSHHTIRANPTLHRNIVLDLITGTPRKRTRPSVNRQISITAPLRRVHAGVVVVVVVVAGVIARKTPRRPGESAKKTFGGAIKDTTIIPHSRPAFDRNFRSKRSRTFRLNIGFSFLRRRRRCHGHAAAGERSFVLVLPSTERLFPLLRLDLVEKYR